MTPAQAVILFGANVNRELARQGTSCRKLASRIGVNYGSLNKTLNRPSGNYGMGMVTAAKIADALGVPLADLLAEPKCFACHDQPPAGFTCNECGGGA